MVAHILDVLPAFLLACVILAALPGPATALFLHRAIRDGRAAGLAAVVGNEIGVLGWTLAGGAGLSMLLMANHALSVVLHVVGAAILIWLGISAWRSAKHPADVELPLPPRGRTPAAAFRAALVSIAANPKAAAFGIVVLPQFLPATGSVLPTLLILAVIQLVVDTAWCVGVVLAADRARNILSRTHIRQRMERAMGAVLVALGLGLGADAR
ncbi:putative threonine efflux protein [Mycolicibacterium mageritense DSM 44476 = CIP 104973]|uniref:Homoserine/homoserine lactone efflux protein n=1 Tax=Mycolicibacterium mageritense TaxID=53462 RepID=A0AAI8XRV4_MYCME|nr:LysE family translocator [Mycolicibacterium mageritense]MCC9185169.1 LysE family translocator [Mycolicibacterium mageritense]TXI57613.1 MAG: LysE family translocator [Mycolicibacterium mageritense]CDO25579.1 putative threonine efflux protein [Mycolicibacterium mageritense DSM 44476 = CIP 104973]BBX37755.1 lysine transporter LysE [Mycolicibacterium mageritense]BDY32455.1 Homoserine/homoserine lactone efflux protein [Mycolicibacterium mageritense]